MSDDLDEILDSMFHGCAWAAYFEQITAEGYWPPDEEATKQRAFRYYEEELAKKNRAKEQAAGTAPTDTGRSLANATPPPPQLTEPGTGSMSPPPCRSPQNPVSAAIPRPMTCDAG
jgi:hypothetical protein